MAILAILVFTAALAGSVAVIALTLAPQWQRVVATACGRNTPFAPLATLVHAERRIAVRRWSAAPLPASVHRLRAAA